MRQERRGDAHLAQHVGAALEACRRPAAVRAESEELACRIRVVPGKFDGDVEVVPPALPVIDGLGGPGWRVAVRDQVMGLGVPDRRVAVRDHVMGLDEEQRAESPLRFDIAFFEKVDRDGCCFERRLLHRPGEVFVWSPLGQAGAGGPLRDVPDPLQHLRL